jgi:hypothetical protein
VPRLVLTVLAVALLPSAAPAAPAPPPPVLLLAASLDGGTAANAPVQAHRGQRVVLYAVIQVGRGASARYHTSAPALNLHGRPIRSQQLRPFADLGAVRFSWLQVEPQPHHVDTDPPNRGNAAYSNAVLFGPRHGAWLGYDRIEYLETPLPGERGPSLTVSRARPTHPKVNVHDGLGTMRYKVTAQLETSRRAEGRGNAAPHEAAPTRDPPLLKTPGAEATTQPGISARVMRVSFRSSNDLVGYLRSYFNVPNVFGSGGHGATHQAELYQGADCADVIVGAARAAGARVAYTSVLGLRGLTTPVTGKLLLSDKGIFSAAGPDKGQPVRLRFTAAVPVSRGAAPGQDEIHPGDILLIDYVGFTDSPRSWDHVGVISEDRGVAGVFDPQDLILHMGYLYGLIEAAAHTEGPAVVQVLRFRPAILRAMAAQQQRRQRAARPSQAAR